MEKQMWAIKEDTGREWGVLFDSRQGAIDYIKLRGARPVDGAPDVWRMSMKDGSDVLLDVPPGVDVLLIAIPRTVMLDVPISLADAELRYGVRADTLKHAILQNRLRGMKIGRNWTTTDDAMRQFVGMATAATPL